VTEQAAEVNLSPVLLGGKRGCRSHF
jgi:hypothetical protein